MNITDKLQKVGNLIKEYESVSNNINTDILKQRDLLEERYELHDGTVLSKKMIMDLYMWKNFSEEYGLDKKGGISLLRDILGNPSEFKKTI